MSPPGPIDRVFGAIVPRAVDAIDMDDVIGQVDVDHLISEVDVDGIVQRVDVDAVVQRVDINAIVQRVDIDGLMGRVDIDALLADVDIGGLISRLDMDALLARVDVDALIQRVDVGKLIERVDLNAVLTDVDLNALMSQLDLDAVLERVDIEALMKRANIDSIVSNASRGVFSRLLDAVRRQVVGLDTLLIGAVLQVFRRRPREQASVVSGTVTGRVAGGVSRLAAFLIDALVLSVSFSLTTALVVFLIGLFAGETVDLSNHGLLWLGGYGLFAFFYYWIGLSITGRSIGKGLIGLRVVEMSGDPIGPGRAAVRTIVYPFSFILGLGLIPIVVGKQRRALHDFAARDHVLYDWGDRPAELPAPLTAWVKRRVEAEDSVEPSEVASEDPGPGEISPPTSVAS